MSLKASKWLAAAILLIALCYYTFKIISWFPFNFPKFKLDPSALNVYYGAPGSGKSTLAAFWASKAIKAGIPVYSNLPISGCFVLDKSDIGKWNIQGPALVIFDEAGAEFNSRNFKANFTLDQIKWYKYHRHENCQVIIFSQGFDDMDKILRTLATNMFIVRKGIFKTVKYERIDKYPDIDDMTHQPIDYYGFTRSGSGRIYAPAVWKMFNSFEKLGLPDKPSWEIWN